MSEIFGTIKKRSERDNDTVNLASESPIRIKPVQGRRGFNKPPVNDSLNNNVSSISTNNTNITRQGRYIGKSPNFNKPKIISGDDHTKIRLNDTNILKTETERLNNERVQDGAKRGTELRLAQKRDLDLLSKIPKATVLNMIYLNTASYEEMKSMAVMTIKSGDMYGIDSVNDPRMGPINPAQDCNYCGLVGCAGHLGFIDFNHLPCYNKTAFRQIISILNVVCRKCSKLLFTKNYLKERGIRGTGPEVLSKLDQLVDSGNIKTFCQMRAANELKTGDGTHTECGAKCAIDAREKSAILINEIADLKRQLYSQKIDIKSKVRIDNQIASLNEELEDVVCNCDATVKRCPKNFKILIKDSEERGSIVYEVETLDDNGKKKKDKYIYPIDSVIKILRNISKEDAKLMGFSGSSKPENLILRGILVIGNQFRASVHLSGGIEFENVITKKYHAIYKAANASEEEAIEIRRAKLSDAIESLMVKSDKNNTRVNKGPQTILELITGKEGLIRRNMVGARVNNFFRTVASNNAYLRAEEVGVPSIFKRILVKEILVNNSNILNSQELFDSGKIVHMIRKRGKYAGVLVDVYEHTYQSGKVQLVPGDIIYRELRDGDITMINRHPTLHKNSMLGFRVVLTEGETVSFNLAITKGFNLDFDGDEANGWIPIAIQTDLEIMQTAAVVNNIISSRDNQVIVAPLMNAPTFAQRLTRPGIFVPQKLIYDIYMILTNIAPYDENTPRSTSAHEYDMVDFMRRLQNNDVPFESGRALFSLGLPKDFIYNENNVYIREGVLINGIVDKKTLGPTHRSMVQEVHKRYGAERALQFINDIVTIIDRWSLTEGQSVGIADCIKYDDELYIDYDEDGRIVETRKRVNVIEEASKKEILKAEAEIQNLYNPDAVGVEAALIENKMKNRAQNVVAAMSKIAKENLQGTRIVVQAEGGGKGSMINVGTLAATPGQQHTHGQRFRPTLQDGKKVLPVFDINEITAESRGLVKHSFLQGMSPAEYYFHAVGSREGIIDTAINTAPAGTLQRQIIKNLEDIIIFMDGSVRRTNGKIISVLYGNDGFEVKHLLKKKYRGEDLAVPIDLEQLSFYLNTKSGWIQGKNLDQIMDNLEQEIYVYEGEMRAVVAYDPLVFKSTRVLQKEDRERKKIMENMKLVDKKIRELRQSASVDDKTLREIAVNTIMKNAKKDITREMLLSALMEDGVISDVEDLAKVTTEYKRLKEKGATLGELQNYALENFIQEEIKNTEKERKDIEKYYNFNLIKTLEKIENGDIVKVDKTVGELAETLLGDNITESKLIDMQLKLINAIPMKKSRSKLIKGSIY